MADFKVSGTLTTEISALRTAANAVNESCTTLDGSQVSTMKTANRMAAEHKAIMELMEMYKALVLKDAKDLDAFVAEAEKMDSSISTSNLR